MRLASIEAIAKALDTHKVQYLVVGGLAVVAHGYGRLTMDMDLVVRLYPDNILAAFAALTGLGYRPCVPITGTQFADEKLRQSWITEKHMKILNLQSDRHRETSIDIFVAEPFDFHAEYARAVEMELVPGIPMRFVCVDTLVAMKEAVARPKDLDDVWHLKKLNETDSGAS